MLKYIVGAIIVVVIAGAAFFIFNGNGSQTDNGAQQPPASGNQSTSTPPPPGQPESTANRVTITNFSFTPSDITVKKGTTVTWTNNDSVQHTVTVDTGDDGPKSQPLASGQTYSFTFNNAGTFNYHCTFHPEMHGVVKVTE